MSTVIVCQNKALPRSIDVTMSVQKAQIESTTDLSVPVFNTPNSGFRHGAERIQYFQSITPMEDLWTADEEPRKAGTTFFSQNPRAATFAVAGIFTTAQAGYAKYKAANTTIATWAAVSDGEFQITDVDGGGAVEVSAIDFSAVLTMDDVNAAIQARLTVASAGSLIEWTGTQFILTSPTTGATSVVGNLNTPAVPAGTDISVAGFMNGQDDANDPTDDNILVPGYTPTGNIADELTLIEEAARCSGQFVYAYTFDKIYRDSSDQLDIAAWVEARSVIAGLTFNSPLVIDPNSTSDLGSQLYALGYEKTFGVYHDNAYYYPEVGILATMLSVNYAAAGSVITAKFKDVVGIPTVPVDETDLSVLVGKRVNTFTVVGNNSRTFREGMMFSSSWFLDERIGMDNYVEELQTALYNVFLQNGVVPYTGVGLALQRGAIDQVSNRYVSNGLFSERELSAEEAGSNEIRVKPAYLADPAAISSMTASDRANRIGPPWTIDVYLSGAIHKTSVNINAFA